MKRHALFVGVDRYADPTIQDLAFPREDAAELASVFRRLLKFDHVEKLENPAHAPEVADAVKDMAQGLGPGDLFLFFFAGHGFRVKDSHVLVCAKDEYGDLVDEYAGLPVGRLKRCMAGPWNRMLVLDACQNDIRATRGADAGIAARDIDLIHADEAAESGGPASGSQIVVTSCSEGQRALEVSDLRHGLFTSALLDSVTAFADARRRIDLETLRTDLGDRMGKLIVRYHLSGEQVPLFSMPANASNIVLLDGAAPMPGMFPQGLLNQIDSLILNWANQPADKSKVATSQSIRPQTVSSPLKPVSSPPPPFGPTSAGPAFAAKKQGAVRPGGVLPETKLETRPPSAAGDKRSQRTTEAGTFREIIRLIATASSALFRFAPAIAMLAAVVTLWRPESFAWVRGGVYSSFLLVVLFATGFSISWRDFAAIAKDPGAVLVGVATPFVVMPLLAWAIAHLLGLSPGLAAGLILVGSCPGSIVVGFLSSLGRGDVAYSVGMTAVVRLFALLASPFLVGWLANKTVSLDATAMIGSVLFYELLPVSAGLAARSLLLRKSGSSPALRIVPGVASLCLAFIVGGVTAAEGRAFLAASPDVLRAAILHVIGGAALGYAVARFFRMPVPRRRALSIAVGVPDAGMGLFLAHRHFQWFSGAEPILAVSCVCSLLAGALLAGCFAFLDSRAGAVFGRALNRLFRILVGTGSLLARFTPLFAVLVAIVAARRPSDFDWAQGDAQIVLFAMVMFASGLALPRPRYVAVAQHLGAVMIGVGAQFIAMPLLALGIARALDLPSGIAAGLILVGCCPGGVASNVLSLLARGDLAYSIGMTTASTLLAPVLTPLLVSWLTGIRVSGVGIGTLDVLLITIPPLLLGAVFRALLGRMRLFAAIERLVPGTVALGFLGIVGGVASTNGRAFLETGAVVFLALFLHNVGGYVVGSIAARVFRLPRASLALEVGVQNTDMGLSLARANFVPDAAPVAAAACVHQLLTGAILAGFYAFRSRHFCGLPVKPPPSWTPGGASGEFPKFP